MKNTIQNTKTLQKYILKLHDELRMRLKFHNNRIDQLQLNKMVYQIINNNHTISSTYNKQNIDTNGVNRVEVDRNGEVQYLKKQIQVQNKLIRKFYNQIKKQHLISMLNNEGNKANLTSLTSLSGLQLTSFNSIISSFNVNTQKNHQNDSNMRTSYTKGHSYIQTTSFDNQNEMTNSIQVKNSIKKDSGRSPRIIDVQKSNQLRQSTTKGIQQQKSKTFAKLRKLQAMFCSKDSKNNPSRIRRRSYAFDFSEINNKQNEIISEQNLNLKAIRNNLVTHLSIMQKYKGVASIEELVHQEEKLKKRQSKVKQLEQYLQNKERKLNKAHTQVLRKQKSSKIL